MSYFFFCSKFPGLCSSRARTFALGRLGNLSFFHTNHMLNATLYFTGSKHQAPCNFPQSTALISLLFLSYILSFFKLGGLAHNNRDSDILHGRRPAKFRFFHEILRNTTKSARNISKYMSAKHISYLSWLLDLFYSPQTSKFILKLRHCNE